MRTNGNVQSINDMAVMNCNQCAGRVDEEKLKRRKTQQHHIVKHKKSRSNGECEASVEIFSGGNGAKRMSEWRNAENCAASKAQSKLARRRNAQQHGLTAELRNEAVKSSGNVGDFRCDSALNRADECALALANAVATVIRPM